MKPGTTGFVGQRLREAREARGITAVSLAEILGVSRAAISQYEHGPRTPSPEVAERIASTLRLPIMFFTRPLNERTNRKIFYRSLSAATKTARIRSERKYEWLEQIVDMLSRFVAFPQPNLPDLAPPAQFSLLGDDAIETFAAACRRAWGLGDGPISNVAWLLENHGIIVSRFGLGADTLDSFCEHNANGRPFVVISSDKEAAVRGRYDAAHELGHLLLHRQIERNVVLRPTEHRIIEEQAHRFAGAFLLPAAPLRKTFFSATLEGLRVLKQTWGVSMQAILMRLRHLDMVEEYIAAKLYRAIAARGWRTREPLDDVIEPEHPELLRQAVNAVLSSGALSRNGLLDMLPYAPSDIEELCGLEPGMLSNTAITFTPFNAVSSPRPQISGEVIPFRPRRD